MTPRIVIALGGNALGNTPEEQKERIDAAVPSLVGLIAQGNEIIVSHGNGPQVGMIDLAFAESSKSSEKIPAMPLAECTAMSEGYIGFHLQNGIGRELRRQGMPWHVASVVTQVEVSEDDPAFKNPTKPIGAYYTEAEANALSANGDVYKEDSGRGFRRLVPSPAPVSIIERDSILNLLDNEFIVIACGGGGIPVVRRGEYYEGVDAVIDKDLASACLAEVCDADCLFILTAIPKVAINFAKPDQMFIDKMTVDQAQKYCDEGHFAPGSMLPKVRAAMRFAASKPGRRSIIASLSEAPLAIRGLAGTEITLH